MTEPIRTVPNLSANQIANFHKHYTKGAPDECWNWHGTTRDGYGRIRIWTNPRPNRRSSHFGANRIAFWLHNGYWPTKYICHTCDNPLCVNPAHLYEGSQLQNMADRRDRGRTALGVQNGKSKLTPEIVRQIRADLKAGATHRETAKKYGIVKSTVSFIRTGATWAWLKD